LKRAPHVRRAGSLDAADLRRRKVRREEEINPDKEVLDALRKIYPYVGIRSSPMPDYAPKSPVMSGAGPFGSWLFPAYSLEDGVREMVGHSAPTITNAPIRATTREWSHD
jgi:hypothetical protein